MDERTRRIGENEAVFRAVNEQILAVTTTLTVPPETIRAVCECGARSCTDQFEVALDDYSRVRADATLFFTRPGHDDPEAETVVEKSADFWIVRKRRGGPAELAEATDPRR